MSQVVLAMPKQVNRLWRAQQALVKHFAKTKLRFTLDGRLVGDIAEALALEHFDLEWPKRRTKGVDAVTRRGTTVQIKATGRKGFGPAFSPGEGTAEYLIVFEMDYEANTATIIYNGPEAPIRALLPKSGWQGSKRVPLRAVLELAGKVAVGRRIRPKA